jgi:MoxR-like ATPase
VEYVKQISSFELMFGAPATPVPSLLTVEMVRQIQSSASQVTLPESLIYMRFQLKTAMEEKEYVLSDRRWNKIGQVWKTSAAIHGRSSVSVRDTVMTPHMLWDFPEDMTIVRELFNHVFQESLKKEMEQELPLQRYDQSVKSWLEKEEQREVGGAISKEAEEWAKAELEQCRSELEETARSLRGRLVAWQETEKKLPEWIAGQTVFLLHLMYSRNNRNRKQAPL